MYVELLQKQKRIWKVACVTLCLVALFAFFIPAVNVDVNFRGMSANASFSLASFFDGSNDFTSEIDSNLPQGSLMDFVNFTDGNNPFADTIFKLVSSVAAYFITAILLVVALICTLVDKFKKASVIMIILSFMLYSYAGYTILLVTESLQTELGNFLGFLALFINVSNIINISLESGFWLTITAIGCLLLLRIFLFIHFKILCRQLSISKTLDTQS